MINTRLSYDGIVATENVYITFSTENVIPTENVIHYIFGYYFFGYDCPTENVIKSGTYDQSEILI